jgi:hypothetical protein
MKNDFGLDSGLFLLYILTNRPSVVGDAVSGPKMKVLP